jgi:glycosyltransferase involved in cell wall biosynthesis
MKTLIIIPAYNEEMNIEGVIADLNKHYSGIDFLVINDGSRDATAKVAGRCGVKVISLPFNLGIGAAMQTGYKYAERNGYDIAVQFDGDGQHRADQLYLLLEPVQNGETDIVIGSRFLGGNSSGFMWSRLAGIRVLSWVISFLTRQKITDPTSGFRAVNRKIIEFYSRYYPDDYPEPEAVVLLHRARCRITEVPVLMRNRLAGISSITPVRALYYMIKVVLASVIDMLKKTPGTL